MARQLRQSLLAALFAAALLQCFLLCAAHQTPTADGRTDLVGGVDENVPALDDDSIAGLVDAMSQRDDGEDEEALEAMYAREAERQREQEKVITKTVTDIQTKNKKKKLGNIILAAAGSLAALLAAAAIGRKVYKNRKAAANSAVVV